MSGRQLLAAALLIGACGDGASKPEGSGETSAVGGSTGHDGAETAWSPAGSTSSGAAEDETGSDEGTDGGSDGGDETTGGDEPIPEDAVYVDIELGVQLCSDYSAKTRACGGGTSIAYGDFDAAAVAAIPGDTIVLREMTMTSPLVIPGSGEAGTPITYRSYPGESVLVTLPDGPFLPGIELTDVHDVVLDGIDVDDVMMFGQLLRASRVTIRNSHFSRARDGGSRGGLRVVDCEDVRIEDNLFEDGNDNLFVEHSVTTLIEDNAFIKARHTLLVLACSSHSVVRGNEFDNEDQKSTETFDCEGAVESLYDDTQQELHMDSTSRNLWEDNRFVRTRASDVPSDYNAMQLAGQRGIVRRNTYWDNLGGGIGLQVYGGEATFVYLNHIYNNTVYDNDCFGIRAAGSSGSNYWGNLVVNNISVDNADCFGDPGNDLVEGNASATTMVANVTEGVVFEDAAQHDLHLAPGSAGIDEGIFVAHTTSSGQGTVVPVDDPGWFYDGYGIAGEVGDTIRLEGDPQTAVVVAVDDDAGTLELDRVLSWSNAQGVSLSYAGELPDAGAFEAE